MCGCTKTKVTTKRKIDLIIKASKIVQNTRRNNFTGLNYQINFLFCCNFSFVQLQFKGYYIFIE